VCYIIDDFPDQHSRDVEKVRERFLFGIQLYQLQVDLLMMN